VIDLEVKQPPSATAWDEALLKLPDPHLLQTWEWGAFKSRHGWEPTRYLWVEPGSGRPRGAASVLTRRLDYLPMRVMYVPRGPIVDYGDADLVERVLQGIETVASRNRALFVKIDPEVLLETRESETLLASLRSRGWRRSDEEIQYRNTVLIDLTLSRDDLLMGMKSKWRYNVRLAKRKGVTVRHGTLDDLPLLYAMYRETANRGEFVIRPEAYYQDAWGSFIEAGLARPFIAEVEGEPVAMLIIYQFGERAIYMYGASRSVHRDKMPNNLLQWKAMQWAKERGCTVYDMWGAPDELDESDPMWGVYRFKKGFGGEFVEHVGAWDYAASRAGYGLYRVVMPHVLAAMRWLHWRRTGESPE
jgi:lipid II:glycine glycyltransferase (peptidoglycan interpeptide bridge formation enzyme)